MLRPLTALALALTLLPGCDSTDEAKQTAKDASDKAIQASKDKAAELAEDAKALGKEAADASKDAANKAVDASKNAANKAVDAAGQAVDDATEAARDGVVGLFDDLTNDGELSQTAKTWLSTQAAKAADTDIEPIVDKGAQLAPIALEASSVLMKAVERDTVVEPIFQKVGDDRTAIDKAIGDMPRVEAIDGVTVGFKQMDSMDQSKSVKQRGYLVMWRHDDYLVGFVYRSTRTLDLDTLVAETPRLIAMTDKVLSD